MPKPGSTTARGYGAKHQALRKKWQAIVDRGEAHCWRCGSWLQPGQPWDLGHDDEDPTVYRGPECRPCNRGTAATRGNRMRGGELRASRLRW